MFSRLPFLKPSDDLLAELVFEDLFQKSEGQDPGPDWTLGEKGMKFEGGSLRVQQGWMATKAEIPGGVRVEFEFEMARNASSRHFGCFLNGLEGFWNGYDASFLEGERLILKRGNLAAASAETPRIKPGKRHKVRFQRFGNRVSLFLDGSPLAEFLDLEPYPEESQGRLGLFAFGSDLRFHSFRAWSLKGREKLSPLSVGDRLLSRGMVESAGQQYRNALPILRDDEKETAGLKIAYCLLREGRSAEALAWTRDMAGWSLSPAGRRRAEMMTLETALAVRSWDDFRSTLERICGAEGDLAERQGVLLLLGRLDELWKAKDMWNPARAGRALELLMAQGETAEGPGLMRILLKLAYLKDGEKSLKETLDRLRALHGPWPTASVRTLVDRTYADLVFGSFPGSGPRSLELGNYHFEAGYSRAALDEARGLTSEKLMAWFLEQSASHREVSDAQALAPLADEFWARGDLARMRQACEVLLETYPKHGAVSGSALLSLAALDLWEGRSNEAGRRANRVLEGYPAEDWLHSLARLASGSLSPDNYLADPQRRLYWTQIPIRLTPLLVSATAFRAAGQNELAKSQLGMIRGISFPWEPSHRIAARYLTQI